MDVLLKHILPLIRRQDVCLCIENGALNRHYCRLAYSPYCTEYQHKEGRILGKGIRLDADYEELYDLLSTSEVTAIYNAFTGEDYDDIITVTVDVKNYPDSIIREIERLCQEQGGQ